MAFGSGAVAERTGAPGPDTAVALERQCVTITRGDGGPLHLEIVNAGKPGIEAELREVKPGERYEMIIALVPPQKPGQLRTYIRIKTGVKEMPETTIPVYADIPPGWSDDGLAMLNP